MFSITNDNLMQVCLCIFKAKYILMFLPESAKKSKKDKKRKSLDVGVSSCTVCLFLHMTQREWTLQSASYKLEMLTSSIEVIRIQTHQNCPFFEIRTHVRH